MALLQIRADDVTGEGRWTKVVIELANSEGRPIIGYGPDGVVIHKFEGKTEHDGVLDVDLVPNVDIQPENSCYRVTLADRTMFIYKNGSTQTLYQALATDLEPLSPVVGAQGPPGEDGDQGPQGPPGPGTYQEYNIGVASTVWTITHNLGLYPNVTTMDSSGSVVEGEVDYVSEGTIQITFAVPFAGTVILT